MLVRATARTAARQFAINHNGWHASDAVPLCLRRNLGLMHVVDNYLMRRASYPLHQVDGVFACRAPSTKDFDFLFVCHDVPPKLLFDF
jgi:hypothetical protein